MATPVATVACSSQELFTADDVTVYTTINRLTAVMHFLWDSDSRVSSPQLTPTLTVGLIVRHTDCVVKDDCYNYVQQQSAMMTGPQELYTG